MAKVSVHEAEIMLHNDASAMKKEYTRMRDIAQKRLQRLQQSHDFDWTKTSHLQDFQKLKDMDIRDLPKAFSELSKFLEAKGSTISGQKESRQKTIDTLNRAIGAIDENDELDKSVPHVTKENYNRVIQILNEARKQKIIYGSDRIVQLADATLGVSQKTFNQILDNLDSMLLNSHRLSQIPELDGYSFEQIQKAIK